MNNFGFLTEHLDLARSIFDTFCTKYAFSHAPPHSIGRYPRIRIQKCGETIIYFDLWMELDDNGRRFEKFRSDLPFELGAGSYFDMRSDSKLYFRFHKAIQCFSGKPLNQVATILESEMEKYLPIVEKWDKHYLECNCTKIQLAG